MTSAFAWRDEYLVGVAEIDAQHRRLIEMIAEFYETLATQNAAKQALGVLLGALLDYTRYHFSTEEKLMERTAFPMSPSHRKQHGDFIAKVSDMADRFARGRLVLSIEATGFLREWLSDHIIVVDKQLARHLISSGVH